jgi:hypothetical protein
MKPYLRRNRDRQNAELHGSFNLPDRRCECGKLESEHSDGGDPFGKLTASGCEGFTELKCSCKPCPNESCESGQVVTEWRHYAGDNNRGPWCATSEALEMGPCPRCKGTGKISEDCLMHVELTALELIEMDGGR